MWTALYVAIALILIVFGYLALLSIGLPFALTGILMLVLFRWRRRADVLAPTLAWPLFFTLGLLLLGPIGCVRGATGGAGVPGGVPAKIEGYTRCNGLLFTYAGGPHYEAPFLPALLISVALATAVSLVTRWALRRKGDRHSIGAGVAA